MPTIIPRTINAPVRSFCQKLNPKVEPVLVPVLPDADAQEGDCFFNVQRKIEREGGSIVYGWRIALWPAVFIEAEHHAIWQSPSGALVDVTVPSLPSARILFVRDDTRVYDYENHLRIDNVRQALVPDPVIQNFLDAAAEKATFIDQHSIGRTGAVTMLSEYVEIEKKLLQAHIRVLRRYLRPDDLCVCGSGKRVKKCHSVEDIVSSLKSVAN